jgi:hypothetical protein
MSRYCKVCNVEIDPRRITILPETQTCTQHSTIEKKVAMVVQMGEGDHTWTETYAIDREVYDKIQEVEKNWKRVNKTIPDMEVKPTNVEDKDNIIDEFIYTDDDTLPFMNELDEFVDVDDEDDYSTDDILEEE